MVSNMDFLKKSIMVLALAMSFPAHGQGLVCDTLTVQHELERNENYQFRWKQTVLPASLMATGAVCLAPSFLRNGSRSLSNEVRGLRCNHQRLEFDDYVQYVPVAGSLLLGSIGVNARHTFGERVCILATSYATLAVLTNVPKMCVDEKRPEFAGHNSFPSGHTATAFMGAELVRIEYGGWYGAAAYAVAGGIGFMRLYNGRHWFHDVVAGAGVGILSARMGEWSVGLWQRLLRKNRKSTKNYSFTPIVSPMNDGYYGFVAGIQL